MMNPEMMKLAMEQMVGDACLADQSRLDSQLSYTHLLCLAVQNDARPGAKSCKSSKMQAAAAPVLWYCVNYQQTLCLL